MEKRMDVKVTDDFRRSVLSGLGIPGPAAEELIEYNKNVFKFPERGNVIRLPLTDEAFVSDWIEYSQIIEKAHSFMALKDKLIELNFPVVDGISKTPGYKATQEKGFEALERDAEEGLRLDAPEKIKIYLHQTIAGKIPVISASERDDFKSIVSALTCRNEPVELPASVGAFAISGYKNRDRLAKISGSFLFGKIPKELYQDKFIIISRGFYSGIAPGKIGMTETEWLEKSMKIRIEHEAAHYVMERLFGSMRKRLLDEIIADYMGITAVEKSYSARLFLDFMGIDRGTLSETGKARIEYYRGELGDEAFNALKKLAELASLNIETLDAEMRNHVKTRFHFMLALSRLSVEEIASGDCGRLLENAFRMNEQLIQYV